MILGLDISTSITGYTILDNEGAIVACEHIDLRKEKNFFLKAAKIEGVLNQIRSQYFVEQVYVEQSIQSFRSGFSSAQTLSFLSKINGIVSWICYNIFGSEPQVLCSHICSQTLRHQRSPRARRQKPFLCNLLLTTSPGFDVEYTRHGNPKAGYADRSDSYVIAKGRMDS